MKKTVFISSTFEDLQSHRAKVWELLENYDVSIRGMENFGARKEAPLFTCLSEVEQSDIFVGIIAYRLGSVVSNSGKSFTQVEYEKANELGKEILIYISDDESSKISPRNLDHGEAREKLQAFKSTLKTNHTPDYFSSEIDLVEKLGKRFKDLLSLKIADSNPQKDDYVRAKEIIEKFMLLPSLYSGREVKVLIDVEGEPFPASKSLCSSFNMNYGQTIGIKMKMRVPQLVKQYFPFLFVDQYSVEEFLAIAETKRAGLTIYAKLQFSEHKNDGVEANFIRREYYHVSVESIFEEEEREVVTKEVIEPEGQIILKLTKVDNQSL